MILTDSNILVHVVDTRNPKSELAESATNKLWSRQEILCVAPQNVVEFWAVATRPADKNGMGMSASRASEEVSKILSLFRLLPYSQGVLDIWRRIVLAHNVSGKQVHDAHLVAIMQAHSVTSILTFNGADFARYPGITVLDPVQL